MRGANLEFECGKLLGRAVELPLAGLRDALELCKRNGRGRCGIWPMVGTGAKFTCGAG